MAALISGIESVFVGGVFVTFESATASAFDETRLNRSVAADRVLVPSGTMCRLRSSTRRSITMPAAMAPKMMKSWRITDLLRIDLG